MSSLHHLWERRRSRSCPGRLGGVPQSASEGWWTRDNLMMGKTFSNKVTCEYWLRLLSCWMTLTAEVQAKHRAKLTNTIRNMMATTSSCHQGSRIQLVLLDDSSWCWWLADHKILCEGLGLSLLSRGCDDRDVVLLLFVFCCCCCCCCDETIPGPSVDSTLTEGQLAAPQLSYYRPRTSRPPTPANIFFFFLPASNSTGGVLELLVLIVPHHN